MYRKGSSGKELPFFMSGPKNIKTILFILFSNTLNGNVMNP